ncbi:Serine/threonine-protein kinase SMG1 [Hordeum vulgare]|nr:Serine/threonine-protein kinase SMG1 [Hordeum vulgare]
MIRLVAEGLAGRAWVQDIAGAMGPLATMQYIELWRRVHLIALADQPDKLRWRWTANGLYSAKSCYDALFLGCTSSPHAALTWKTWASLSVKFFMWLALQDRCWTSERLARHGLPHPLACVLCDQAPKSMQHLLIGCPFSRWHGVFSKLRLTATMPTGQEEFFVWWQEATATA